MCGDTVPPSGDCCVLLLFYIMRQANPLREDTRSFFHSTLLAIWVVSAESWNKNHTDIGQCVCNSLVNINWVRLMGKECGEVIGWCKQWHCARLGCFLRATLTSLCSSGHEGLKWWRTRGMQQHRWWDTHIHTRTGYAACIADKVHYSQHPNTALPWTPIGTSWNYTNSP